jgi:hypothetical protein
MPSEGDLHNFLDALSDLRNKLHYREEMKHMLTDADRAVLDSIARLRGLSRPTFTDEHHELDAMLIATRILLDESLVRKDTANEAQEKLR